MHKDFKYFYSWKQLKAASWQHVYGLCPNHQECNGIFLLAESWKLQTRPGSDEQIYRSSGPNAVAVDGSASH